MNARNIAKFELIIGAVLTLLAIVGFLLLIVLNLPRSSQIDKLAQPLPTIPERFFSADNPVIRQIQQLEVPSGVPVEVELGNLGRSNAFESY